MRKSIFKSKVVTGAMALMLTVSMMPGMAFAEDAVSSVVDDEYSMALQNTGELRNPVVASGVSIQFGDINTPTAPECYMDMIVNGNLCEVEYAGPYGNTEGLTYDEYAYYPDTLALHLKRDAALTTGEQNIYSVANLNNNILIETYDNEGNLIDSGYSLSTPGEDGYYVLRLDINSDQDYELHVSQNGASYVLMKFKRPKAYVEPTGGYTPAAIVSYMPIGQFAKGHTNWASIHSDNNYNQGTQTKFVNGYNTTGVSLGALGGYIEFAFPDDHKIKNNPYHPYGVDFVVYGNAFDGNPEAGAVQVSEDGKIWYELAGSRYYDNFSFDEAAAGNNYHNAYSGTLRNTEVEYYKVAGNEPKINVKLGDNTVHKFTDKLDWWPQRNHPAPAAHKNNGSNVKVYKGDTTLKFTGITAVEDSDTNAEYAFGYADVTPNGMPAQRGTPENPYSATTGGDGFDLEWAVDINTGLPIDVSDKEFKYVRVYSAVLDNSFPFGETSTEVCGIFTTYTVGTDDVGRTAKPNRINFSANGVNYSITDIPSDSGNVGYEIEEIIDMFSGAINIYVSIPAVAGANVYINNTKLTESSTGQYTGAINLPISEQALRVIVQEGNKAPYIYTMK